MEREYSAVMDSYSHSGYQDFVWSVELHRFGLDFVGLWPKTDQSTFVSDLRVLIIFVIVTFLSVVPLLCSLIQIWGDMILIVDNLQVTLPLVIVSWKLIIMRWKRSAVSLMVNMIAEDWMVVKIGNERDVMIRRARTARLLMICGYSLMVIANIFLIVLPSFGFHFRYLTNFTDGDRLLPLQGYYFYDTNKSPQYEFTLVAQALTMTVGGIAYTSVDSFFGLTILHICGQLENFKRKVANMVSSKHFDSALRNTIKTHLRLIRFADIIEETFTLLMLGLVFYFGIAFCLFGFLLVTIVSDEETSDISYSRKCFIMVGVVTLISHTLLYCAGGEIVAEQCEGVYRAFCDFEWYTLELRKERTFILLMLRANKPFRITAGKIFSLTMSTFCTLLKTSAGYVSFLLAMVDMKSFS